MKTLPVGKIPTFNTCKLGTEFIHIPTQRIYVVRQITHPTTFEPTRYLWHKQTEHEIFDTVKKDWKPV